MPRDVLNSIIRKQDKSGVDLKSNSVIMSSSVEISKVGAIFDQWRETMYGCSVSCFLPSPKYAPEEFFSMKKILYIRNCKI